MDGSVKYSVDTVKEVPQIDLEDARKLIMPQLTITAFSTPVYVSFDLSQYEQNRNNESCLFRILRFLMIYVCKVFIAYRSVITIFLYVIFPSASLSLRRSN